MKTYGTIVTWPAFYASLPFDRAMVFLKVSFPDSLISRLPQWVVALIALTLVVYLGVLGGVAILTERDVKFWPPEIGPGPKSKIVEEFKRFETGLQSDISELLAQRKILNENLQIARSGTAKAKALSNISEAMSWERSEDNLKNEIKEVDSRIISKLEDAKLEVRQLVSKFNGS